MSAAPFRLEPLRAHHDRQGFQSGVPSLDAYLKTQATQDLRRKACSVFVLVPAERPERIVGYFTLSAMSLSVAEVPAELRKRLPRYPHIGATLIGRLAIDRAHQGQRLGTRLLARAVRLAFANTRMIGSAFIVVDALDERAVSFYEAHGFRRLEDTARLILPMATLAEKLDRA